MKHRKLILLNFLVDGPVRERRLSINGIDLDLTEHEIGWDLETAKMLIRKYDGYVDGIAISGVQKNVTAGRDQFAHPIAATLMRIAVKTPIYFADDVRDLIAEWTLQRVLKEQPQIFSGRKVLFHCAVASPFLKKIQDAGAKISAADAMIVPGIPFILKSTRQIETYARTMRHLLVQLSKTSFNPQGRMHCERTRSQLEEAMKECDVFVSFANALRTLPNLDALADKILIVDYLTPSAQKKLEKNPPAQIIEFAPDHPEIQALQFRHFSVLAAVIDQIRLSEDNPMSFEEYMLRWIQEIELKPRKLKSSRGIVRRCAFVIHPLSSKQLWKGAGLPMINQAPPGLRKWAEFAAARYPVFKFGTLQGAISTASGQEVICDLYAIPATPKQILAMDEEFLYKRLVEACELAQKNGASLIGLGAYTKVAGDAGVTVARRSPIPVTNGNSYSASATLWAARIMVEKMGFVRPASDGKHLRAKAMVIGATGSIGRVSALLLSLVFDELVLVATRADKLLELRQEVLELSPMTKVKVTTNPNLDLPSTDLIVTATSNQNGTILDMDQVKPGAVICDCSRPLDIGPEEAAKRPDVLVIESGEIRLPGNDVTISCDIGLPKPAVYACLAETVLLTMEGRYESFSLSKQLCLEKTKEIYKIGVKHGAELSEICGPNGVVTEEQIAETRRLAAERLGDWFASHPGLKTQIILASTEKAEAES